MMFKKSTLIALISIVLLSGCFVGAGTHGSIKGYAYSCPKDTLQKAVMTIIRSNPNIARDTTLDSLGTSPLLNHSDRTATVRDNYYNDIKHYVAIKITSGIEVNNYTFRYYGPDEDWKTSLSSELFICYAYDRYGAGGSEGNGGINRHTKKLTQMLTGVFEKELIDKVDSLLQLTHTLPE